MSEELEINSDLQVLFSSQNSLLQNLRDQLNKDLNTTVFNKEVNLPEEFLEHITQILNRENEMLKQILYRIDLDEKYLKFQDNLNILSRGLLIREIQKVRFKQQYRQA